MSSTNAYNLAMNASECQAVVMTFYKLKTVKRQQTVVPTENLQYN